MVENVFRSTLSSAASLAPHLTGDSDVPTVVVLFFGAKWARVSAVTQQFLEQQASRFPKAKFFLLDERDCGELSRHLSINAFPTTLVIQDGITVAQRAGGDQAAIARLLQKHCSIVHTSDTAQQSNIPQAQYQQETVPIDNENELLQQAIQESQRTAAREASSIQSPPPHDLTEEEKAAQLEECLAAVRQMRAKEKEDEEKQEKLAQQKAASAQIADTSTNIGLHEDILSQPAGASVTSQTGGTTQSKVKLETSEISMQAEAEDAPIQEHEKQKASRQEITEVIEEENVDRGVSAQSLDEALLAQLLELDIPQEQAKNALLKSGAKTIDEVMDYIVEQQDTDKNGENAEISEQQMDAKVDNRLLALKPGSGMTGYVCTDTGKLFRTMIDAQLYAERTGHVNFDECEIEVRERTAEEKTAQREALMKRIREKKTQKALAAKEHARKEELERRQQGMVAAKQQQELRAAQRKREVEKMKREKAEKAAAKKRQLELWELDAKERASGTSAAAAFKGPRKLTIFEAEAKTKKSIESLKTYVGGVGLQCLTTLAIYVANARKDDPKYRRINIGNKAFQKRVKPCIGHGGILLAAGFEKIKDGDEVSPDGYWTLKNPNEKKLAAILAILERGKRSPGFR